MVNNGQPVGKYNDRVFANGDFYDSCVMDNGEDYCKGAINVGSWSWCNTSTNDKEYMIWKNNKTTFMDYFNYLKGTGKSGDEANEIALEKCKDLNNLPYKTYSNESFMNRNDNSFFESNSYSILFIILVIIFFIIIFLSIFYTKKYSIKIRKILKLT